MSDPIDDGSRLSRYLDDLPAVYSEDPGRQLLGRFLLAFEKILTGLGDPTEPGLEEILDGIPDLPGKDGLAGIERYFTPGPEAPEGRRAPAEFLEWLAGWVALTLRADWNEAVRRRVLADIVPTYALRGTPAGLRRIVKAFTGLEPRIDELLRPFQLGVSSVVGERSAIGGAPPHYFQVEAFISVQQAVDFAHQEEILRAAIDASKPAHTWYDLRIEIPEMQIGVHSTVGVDTVLGNVAGDGPQSG